MDFHLESFDAARDIVGFGDISNAVKLFTGNQAKRTPRGISTEVAQNKGTSMREMTICPKLIQLKNDELADKKWDRERGDPKNEGMSTEVYENKRLKKMPWGMSTDIDENKRVISFVQKLMKIKAFIKNPQQRHRSNEGQDDNIL
jgi:hypothetical protein